MHIFVFYCKTLRADKLGPWGPPCLPSAVNLCSNTDDKLQIYRENFEKAYMDSTERFYRTQAPSYLQQNGVQNYMKYVRITRIRVVQFL
jgi:hypothetical protein